MSDRDRKISNSSSHLWPVVRLGLAAEIATLTAELLRREYSEEDILKILGRNVLRLMRDVEGVAGRLQVERQPSEVLIEELDGRP